MAVDTDIFPQSALEANRNGSLTDVQRQGLRGMERGTRKGELSFAALAVAIGFIVLVGARSSAPVLAHVGIPLVCVVIAIFLMVRALGGGDKLARDLRNPRVESLEGPISRRVRQVGSSTSGESHYLTVAGRQFEVGRRAYAAAPDAGFVRIYFLSISGHVVNLENLPDRSLADGTTPQAMAQEYKQALHSHDRAQIDEVRAEMAGTAHAFQAAFSENVAPPPEESRDQRPLAEAIQGRWSNGPITADFSQNGTFSITILG